MKLLVIGCGSIGKRHVANAANYADVAVYDSNLEYQTECLSSVPFFNNLESAWQWAPQAVVVATPHQSHIELARQALANGAHVLIEKPIAASAEGVAELLRYAKDQRRHVYVACNMRFHPAIALLKTNLSKIGRPLFARAHFGNYLPNMRPGCDYRQLYAAKSREGGGVILDAIHEVDYLCWLLGEITDINASAAKLSHLEIDVEDYACLLLTHATGARSEIHLDYLQHYKRRGCEVVGERGTLLWQSWGKQPERCSVQLFLQGAEGWQALYRHKDLDVNHAYLEQLKQFIAAVQGQPSDLATGEDGLASLVASLHACQLVQERLYGAT